MQLAVVIYDNVSMPLVHHFQICKTESQILMISLYSQNS